MCNNNTIWNELILSNYKLKIIVASMIAQNIKLTIIFDITCLKNLKHKFTKSIHKQFIVYRLVIMK